MTEETTFELATAADTETLVPMIREFYAYEGLAFDETRVRDALGQLLGDARLGRVWIVRAGGEAAGYVVLTFGFSLEFAGRDAFLDELFLREAHRGGGLGRRAIETAAEACRALGIRALHLEVERHNSAAQEFYRRMGFTDHDRYLLTRWLDA
ncbi:MAG TPA: GNAT family N-acetyltransferase [Longimicrobium sp.]|nr:GNAT family N-acetyltransferase [Longimicrobium sp.]